MTDPFSADDLTTARTWLQRASNALSGGQDSPPESVAYAHAAAAIGNGFVNLGHATRALEAMDESSKVTARQLVAFDAIAEAAADAEVPTLGAAIERERQAHAEARPHDDDPVPVPCPRCEGCGQVADTDDREPWTAWENLPPGSDLAVKAGLVKPVPCGQCGGEKTVLRRPSAGLGGDRG